MFSILESQQGENMAIRTMICKVCSNTFTTDQDGRFYYCNEVCKQKKLDADAAMLSEKRNKVCLKCNASYRDESKQNSQKFCSEICAHKAKVFKQDPNHKFLDEHIYNCVHCQKNFTPTKDNQIYCTLECRGSSPEYSPNRNKSCFTCTTSFVDSSLKNNTQYCSLHTPGFNEKETYTKKRDGERPCRSLEHRRMTRVRNGEGGRIDDLTTMDKFTDSWWGRVSELIFQAYFPEAADMNKDNGCNHPWDFEEKSLGRVEIRGRVSGEKYGKDFWSFDTVNLHRSCGHMIAFCYHDIGAKRRLERIWCLPVSILPLTSIVLCPTSKEYKYGDYEVTKRWGIKRGNDKMREVLSLPDPIRPKKYSWMLDPNNLDLTKTPHIGRRGELIYSKLYPNSKDMNLISPNHKYDFEDEDGIIVNVKASKSENGVWGFGLGSTYKEKGFEHSCDIYSCICIEQDMVSKEYRIPSHIWGNRRTLNIHSTGLKYRDYLVQRDPIRLEDLNVTNKTLTFSTPTDLPDYNLLSDLEKEDLIHRVYLDLHKLDFPYSQVKKSIDRILGQVIYNDQEISSVGNDLCKSVMKHRYETKNADHISAFDAWHDEKHLKRAIRFQLKYNNPCTPSRVLRALEANVRTPTNFRPVTARQLIDTYCPVGGTVLDPCAGWGGRLLGAACSSTASKYIGIDVEPRTVTGLRQLSSLIGPYLSKDFRTDLIESRSEYISLSESVDLVLTSPPYYNAEIYSDHPDQSCHRYTTYESWLEGFLAKMIQNASSVLRSGGYFLLNIADVKRGRIFYPLVQDAHDLLIKAGLLKTDKLFYPLRSLGGKREPETIWVFRQS